MSAYREFGGVVWLGLASHCARPRHLALIAAGFLIGGFVLIFLLVVAAGFERLGAETGADDVAIVFAASARNESDSALKPEAAALVGDVPGVAHDSVGLPLIAPQFIASTKLRRTNGELATVLVRGITPATWTLIGTRIAHNGTHSQRSNELIAGAAASLNFVGLDPGASAKVRNTVWHVADRFESGGLWDSELWADIASLQASFNAPAALSVLWVKLDSPAAFATFEAALGADKRLRDLRTELQRSYYDRQVHFVSRFVRIAAAGIAAALGMGAALAIANALTLALVARRRELAILRALGYSRGTLALALVFEVWLTGLLATLLAIAVMCFALDGVSIGSSTGSQAVSFTLVVTPETTAWACAYALLLGTISAAWPAWQAVRAPLLIALRGE